MLAKQFGWGEDWDEIEKRALAELVPNSCGRIGRPDDIANAVAIWSAPARASSPARTCW